MAGKRIRTVVVDDSSFVRESLWRLFATLPGIELIAMANNGSEAVEMVTLTKPQLVLMDFQMPGINGLQAAWLIRQRHPEIRIVLMTAHDVDKVKASGFAQSVDAFISKQELADSLAGTLARLFPKDTSIDDADNTMETPESADRPKDDKENQ